MAGRLLRDHLKEIIRSYEPETDPVITIAGLSNLYTHYITTPEEYDAQFRIKFIMFSYYYVTKLSRNEIKLIHQQRYEAASTIYGRNTFGIYLRSVLRLNF